MTNDDVESLEAINAQAAIRKALEILGEHYGAVQILASHETVSGDTVLASWGLGNWYARQGMAHQFLDTEIARNFAWEMKSKEDDEE